jgi:hypothetical protein
MIRARGSARLTAIVSAGVIAAVIVALFLIDPALQRRLRVDAARVQHLAQIETALDEYWRRHEAMPQDLESLATEPGFDTVIQDPETGKRYGFEPVDVDSYLLCADFLVDWGKLSRRHQRSWDRNNKRWSHPAGRFCFTRDIRKPEQAGES